MTEGERNNVAILKWVINPALSVPKIEGLDEDAFFEIVEYHRIVGHVLARLEAARPSWCPARLLTKLRVKQHRTRQGAQARMAAATEITRTMQERGLHPPIFIKGFAAHALTSDPASLHYSGDLDPFAEDLPKFWNVLYELGYAGKRKDSHEWAKLSRGGITLDIHQHFSILTYPEAVRAMTREQLDAHMNPGHWHLPDSPSGLLPNQDVITWNDLVKVAKRGNAEGTKELLFPSPTLLCFIHCVHCFRSSITRLHYMNPIGGFRLYELLAIRDLAECAAFDAAQFLDFAHRFQARDAVNFVEALAQRFLGISLSQKGDIMPSADASHIFPEQLIYGGWVSLQQADDWLLLRTIEQLLEQLDAVVMPATSTVSTRTAPRVLTFGDGGDLSLQVKIVWDKQSRTVASEWEILELDSAGADHDLMIHFGYGSYVEVHVDANGRIGAVNQKSDYLRSGQQPTVENIQGTDRREVRIVCQIPNFPTLTTHPALEMLPLFLAVRRLRADAKQTNCACYLPLLLQSSGVLG